MTNQALRAGLAEPTIWLYDDSRNGYHDINRCKCDGHCGNCFEDLATVRAVRDRLIAEGAAGYGPENRLHPRARYCSDYCKNFAKRDRAFGRRLSAITPREN